MYKCNKMTELVSVKKFQLIKVRKACRDIMLAMCILSFTP